MKPMLERLSCRNVVRGFLMCLYRSSGVKKVSDVTLKALDHGIRSANKAKAKSSWVS